GVPGARQTAGSDQLGQAERGEGSGCSAHALTARKPGLGQAPDPGGVLPLSTGLPGCHWLNIPLRPAVPTFRIFGTFALSLIRSYANICSYMVICVLLPLLALRAALGDARNRLREPIALAPQHDGARLIGEVSPAAHALGVRPGMGLGEATDICPELELIAPDPTRAEAIHEAVLRRLEAIGAEVESERSGEAFFTADEIERLYGGLDGVLEATRRQLGPNPLLAAAPTRLAAFAAARASDPGPAVTVSPEDLPRF